MAEFHCFLLGFIVGGGLMTVTSLFAIRRELIRAIEEDAGN